MINFQVNEIKMAMSMDKKDPFQRLSKLLEEQGELLEAYFDNADILDSIEEAVDNLLVTTSIAYVIDNDSMLEMESIFSFHYQKENKPVYNPLIHSLQSVDSLLIHFSIQNGKISDAVQKYLKVGASCYKGSLSKEEVLDYIKKSIVILSQVIHKLVEIANVDRFDYVNKLICKKNSKWLEKSILGNKQ